MTMEKVQPSKTRVGFIGTGVMGRSMAQHIMNGGYSLTVSTRTKSKAEPLLNAGAAWADTPKAVAERSDVVIAIVGYPKDVREVFLGANGALAGSRPGGILVDMTTSEPTLARDIYDAAKRKQVASLDAPVSGGDVGAKNATLSIMVGGDAEALEAVKPIFECMGKLIVHQGSAGMGQHTKAVNQILIAGAITSVCEAMLYAYRAGLDPTTVLQSVGAGAAGSWQLNNLGPRIIADNFEPGFFVEHFIKDLGIALDEARRMNIALPGIALAQQLYIAVQSQGYGRKGTQALLLALEKMSNVPRPRQLGP